MTKAISLAKLMKLMGITFTVIALIISFLLYNDKVNSTKYKLLLFDLLITNQAVNLMLGSSSVANLDADLYLECGSWLNRGIGSSTIEDTKSYLNLSLAKISPKNIILYAGENDIKYGNDTQSTIDAYIELINLINAKYPQSHLHIVEIKYSPARSLYWSDVEKVNAEINKYSESSGNLTFHPFNPGKLIDANYYQNDGIHLNQDGYRQFTKGINQACVKN